MDPKRSKPTDSELQGLRALRRVARQVHPLFVKYRNHRFSVTILARNAPDSADLIPKTDFESLGRAVRLVYQDREPSNFYKVRAILGRYGTVEIQQLAAELKRAWQDAIQGRADFVLDGHHYSGKDVFETWLHGVAFHQDEDRKEDVERLASVDPMTSQVLQFNVLRIAGCILALDSLVAELLGEDPLDPQRSYAEDWMFQ